MTGKNGLLNELTTKQLKNLPTNKRLQYTDLKRIAKYLNTSIFDENKCSIWDGYVTNMNNVPKGVYINFYFRHKKIALHRLLYNNFVEDLGDDEYVKFNCPNKGKCCNINHMTKYKYVVKSAQDVLETNVTEIKNEIKKKDEPTNDEKDFVISF